MKQIKVSTRITNRDSSLIDSYFNDINKYELMSQDEEVEAARVARETGCELAIQKLVTSNLRFAVTVAKSYQSTGVPLPDLINDAGEGLLKAAIRFDERKGFKFISFAVWWIRQSILSSLNNNGRTIRLPSNKVSDLTKFNRFCDNFFKENSREPIQEEVCESLDFSEKEYNSMLSAQSQIVSLNKPFGEDDNSTIEDLIPSLEYGNLDREILESSRKETVKKIFSLLEPREADALRVEFGFGGTYESVAKKHNISKERVRQLKQVALVRIRSKKGVKSLCDLL